MACGLNRTEALDTPFGEIQDFAAIYQIKQEGARYANPSAYDEEVIPDVC